MAENGTIHQINSSKGGVPKTAIPAAEVTPTGLAGDLHNNPDVHGGPERAVCLYSLERIQALQAEGHPIIPGAAGENVTVAGLDWANVTIGTRLRLGSQVLLEVTRFTVPCNTIRDAFVNKDSSRISQTQYPGWSRVYTRVLQTGGIATGDTVVIE
jgi:MOSC domain-containing protein YiiM